MAVTRDSQSTECLIESAARILLNYGQMIGPFMPWHNTTDRYRWLIAESLLRRTTRTAACKAYQELIAAYPTWSALASASQEEIAQKVAWIGLGNTRSRQLRKMAQVVIEAKHCALLCERDKLVLLPGVGTYTADAVLLYACGKKAFPIDANIQRVIRRVLGLSIPNGTRHLTPYQDSWIKKAVEKMMSDYVAEDLLRIHRGILHIAWESCRLNSKCVLCPLKQVCECALQQR